MMASTLAKHRRQRAMDEGERIADQSDHVQHHRDGEDDEERAEHRIGPEACGIVAAVDGPAAPGVDDAGLEVLPQIIRRPHAEQFKENGAEEGVHGKARLEEGCFSNRYIQRLENFSDNMFRPPLENFWSTGIYGYWIVGNSRFIRAFILM